MTQKGVWHVWAQLHSSKDSDASDLSDRLVTWGSYDRTGVATVLLQGALNDLLAETNVKTRVVRVDRPAEMVDHLGKLGLALWVPANSIDIDQSLQAIQYTRHRRSQIVCSVWLDASLVPCAGLFLEAGAQIIASRLPSLERSVRSAASRFLLTTPEWHPLTEQLMDNLPWLDDQ